MNEKLIYLASPYTSTKLETEELRFIDACLMAAKLINKGYFVFSPIVHFHPVKKYGILKGDFKTWKKTNHCFLSLCDEFWILTLEGWKESKGIKQEILWAKDLKLPIVYLKE